jgi:hypothetical protein
MSSKSRTSTPRVSSPFGLGGASDPVMQAEAEKPKTAMQKWLEPKVRQQPSFVDHGFDRIGVVAGMEALGTLPSSKQKAQRLKPEGGTRLKLISKKDTAVASALSTPKEVVEFDIATPEPQMMNLSRRRSDSRKEDDDDYNPSKTPHSQTSGRKSGSRPPVPQSSSPIATPQPFGDSEDKLRKLDKIVRFACEQAVLAGRLPTAYAVHSLYEQHRANPRIVAIIEAVYTGRANAEQYSEFRDLMRYKKREGRNNGQAANIVQTLGLHIVPSPHFSTNNLPFTSPTRMAYSHSDTARKTPPAEPRPSSKHSSKSPQKEHVHIAKKHKGNNFAHENSDSGSKSPKMNGSPVKSRRGSVSSSSSLSSVDEDILREGSAPLLGMTDQGATATEIHAGNRNRPMTIQQTLGPKLHTLSTSALNSNPVASSSSSSSSHPTAQSSHNIVRRESNGAFEYVDLDELAEDQRELAKNITASARVRSSNVRTPLRDLGSDFEENGLGGTSSQSGRGGPSLRLRTGVPQKRPYDDSDQLSSPTLLPFQQEFAPGSATPSRAATPTHGGRPSRKAKTGSGLRIKTS